MKRPEFSDLKIKRQFRNEPSPYYYGKLIAYDTETYDGKAVLICDSDGNYIYPESYADCINFLTRKKYYGALGWFLNINYDVEAILKWLVEEDIRELIGEGELTDYVNMVDKVRLKLLDRKMLILTRHKKNFKFYDIGNFYKGGLDKNAQKYLGERKMVSPIDWNNYTIDDLKTKEAIKYCQRDADLTRRLAQNFMDTCNSFGIYTSNFCSPASLATSYFTQEVKIPTLNKITKGKKLRVKYAYEAYKGGFIQTFKRGYFENVYLYDINSAYPYNMTKLPDLSKGRIIYKSDDKVPTDAYMGWIRCRLNIPNDRIYGPGYYSPIATYIKKFNKNYYFNGEIDATITLDEYWALCEDYEIDIKSAFYFIPNSLEFLYKNEIEKLYELRRKHKKDINLNVLLKTVLNGFYGKLIQKIPKKLASDYEFETGNLFNPFHASYITGGCRLQVYELIKQFGAHNLIAVMTDGVAFSEPLEGLDMSPDLGDWSLDMQGEGVFIGSGLYTIKSDEKTKTATRGFKLTSKLDFFNLLAQNPENKLIELDQRVRLTYREACRVKRFPEWNIIQQGIKRFNINSDSKRIWARNFKNCRDVLETVIDSNPYFVNM